MLPRLQGDAVKLQERIARLGELVPETIVPLQHIQQVAERVAARYPQTPLYFDLTELRGYNYHTGLLFAAYIPGYGDAIAQGGRYDETGAVFGRARPATGFSADLKVMSRFGTFVTEEKQTVVAPDADDAELWAEIAALRAAGKRVLIAAEQDAVPADWYLKKQDGQWQLVEA